MNTPTPDDGGPAFPVPNEYYPNGQIQYGFNGMSLRDWFAGQALAGLCASHGVLRVAGTKEPLINMTTAAYLYADAMIEARKEKL